VPYHPPRLQLALLQSNVHTFKSIQHANGREQFKHCCSMLPSCVTSLAVLLRLAAVPHCETGTSMKHKPRTPERNASLELQVPLQLQLLLLLLLPAVTSSSITPTAQGELCQMHATCMAGHPLCAGCIHFQNPFPCTRIVVASLTPEAFTH
jgi:hypothetical protein